MHIENKCNIEDKNVTYNDITFYIFIFLFLSDTGWHFPKTGKGTWRGIQSQNASSFQAETRGDQNLPQFSVQRFSPVFLFQGIRIYSLGWIRTTSILQRSLLKDYIEAALPISSRQELQLFHDFLSFWIRRAPLPQTFNFPLKFCVGFKLL